MGPLQTLKNCGDAIRIESTGAGMSCLDNTLWFDSITDSKVGEGSGLAAAAARPPAGLQTARQR